MIISVFDAFSEILLTLNQEESSLRSSLTFLLMALSEFPLHSKLVSSAKWNVDECLMILYRSLIYSKQNSVVR